MELGLVCNAQLRIVATAPASASSTASTKSTALSSSVTAALVHPALHGAFLALPVLAQLALEDLDPGPRRPQVKVPAPAERSCCDVDNVRVGLVVDLGLGLVQSAAAVLPRDQRGVRLVDYLLPPPDER